MLKGPVFERSRRELSLDVSVGVHILLVVEQSSLESQSRGCAKTPILTIHVPRYIHSLCFIHTINLLVVCAKLAFFRTRLYCD